MLLMEEGGLSTCGQGETLPGVARQKMESLFSSIFNDENYSMLYVVNNTTTFFFLPPLQKSQYSRNRKKKISFLSQFYNILQSLG